MKNSESETSSVAWSLARQDQWLKGFPAFVASDQDNFSLLLDQTKSTAKLAAMQREVHHEIRPGIGRRANFERVG
jgi:hypothetical protein